ncbi:guanylate kinase [Pseudomonadota bacterium]
MIILSSPSGAGKSTLSRLLIKFDKNIKLSISATTRPRRNNEVNGKDYHFITKEKYKKMVKNHEFLETAEVFGNYYGSIQKTIQEMLNNGNDVLFDIDWQGAKQITEEVNPDNLLKIFILPPSLSELEKRLKRRAQDKKETIKLRMNKAKDEISHYDEYDYVIINDDLKEAFRTIQHIIESKRIFNTKKKGLKDFIDKIVSN